MISEILKPTIELYDIEIKHYSNDLNNNQQELYNNINFPKINDIGKNPVVMYNGILIQPALIESLYLKSNEFLPTLQMYFRDDTGEMISNAFALDNTIISVLIDSRTKDNSMASKLRPIRIDFKITEFNHVEDENLFYIQGIMNIDGLYIQDIKAYDKTSFECLKELCSIIKIGMFSNIENTNDKMKWLNMSIENYTFIKDVTKRAYKTDNSFFTSFVDFYYNLNFIDVEQCLTEELTHKTITTTFGEGINESDSQYIDDLYIIPKKYIDSRANNTYSSFEVMNQSTKISLNNGYRNIVHYYDRTGNWDNKGGTFLRFVVETNTDNKGIILKSLPKDNNGFFKSNSKKTYMQPLDVDNTHKNFNFAYILNEYNNAEIEKILIKVTLNAPNFNFYKFQRILVYVMTITLGKEQYLNQRLTGYWIIKEINFLYTNTEGIVQELILNKRELSAKDLII